MPDITLDTLVPGDVLLYRSGGLFNRIIQIKTYSAYSHCELYDGHGWALGSRNGLGVGRYSVRLDGLRAVLRLRVPFDMDVIRDWHETVEGQPYDWFGLLAFTSAKLQGKENFKMFCSEYIVRALRIGIGAKCAHPTARKGSARVLASLGLDPFNGYDADGISPGELKKSALLATVAEA